MGIRLDIFSLEHFSQILSSLTAHHHFCVAYSGGLDSHVLLLAMAEYRAQNPHVNLRAIHINHGWSDQADAWEKHVKKTCEDLTVPLTVHKLSLRILPGESLENQMRQARYDAFKAILEPLENLLVAHTENDQAETFLLQLLRGAGIKGLSAMPYKKVFGSGFLLRPLLDFSREALQQYAQAQKIQWIEDESNKMLRFNRNYIRHQVMPILCERFPKASMLISRSAQHCADAQVLLDELADQDLKNAHSEKENALKIEYLKSLSVLRLRNVLRRWITRYGFLLPHTEHWNVIIDEVLFASPDARAVFAWDYAEIRRHRDYLYLCTAEKSVAPTIPHAWNLKAPLSLGNFGTLYAHPLQGQGLSTALDVNKITVRFRQGGESLRLKNRKGSHTLKKLMQEWNIPSWERDRIPLIYYNDQLAMVVGYAIDEKFLVSDTETGWVITLKKEKENV